MQLDFFPSKTLTLYLARTFVVRIAAVLVMLVLVLQALDLLSQSSKVLAYEGNGQGELLRYIGYRMPQLVARFLPYSVLLATIITLATFNQNSEVVAMKAAGLSAHQILAPLLLAALAVSVISFAFNERIVTRSSAALSAWQAEDYGPVAPDSDVRTNVYLRDGDNILSARVLAGTGEDIRMRGVQWYRRDAEGRVTEKISAPAATYANPGWLLDDPVRFDVAAAQEIPIDPVRIAKGVSPRQAELAQPVDGAGDGRLRYLQGLGQPAHHVWRRRQVDAQQQRHLPGRQVWRFQPDAGDEGAAPDIECLQVGELRVHFRSLIGQFPVSGFRRIVSIAEFLTNPNRRREKFLVNHFRLVDPQQLGRGLAFGYLFQGIQFLGQLFLRRRQHVLGPFQRHHGDAVVVADDDVAGLNRTAGARNRPVDDAAESFVRARRYVGAGIARKPQLADLGGVAHGTIDDHAGDVTRDGGVGHDGAPNGDVLVPSGVDDQDLAPIDERQGGVRNAVVADHGRHRAGLASEDGAGLQGLDGGGHGMGAVHAVRDDGRRNLPPGGKGLGG